MSLVDAYAKSLKKLPPHVQSKMEEVGLRDTLERVLAGLRSDDIADHDEVEQLHHLVNWTLSVLASAAEPLDSETFQELQNDFLEIAIHAHNRNWHHCLSHIRPILGTLSYLPTTSPRYSLEAAQALRTELNKATRTLAESEAVAGVKRRNVETTVEEAATALIQALSNYKEGAAAEMAHLLEDLQERYGFTAGQVLGGAHEIAADAEEKLAESHGTRSRRTMWGAVIWAAIAQIWWLTPLAPDWERWFDAFRSLPIVGSPIIILLFVAKREGKVAAEHRMRHGRLQSLALQFKSWEPYRSTLKDLPDEAKLKMEQQIAARLFAGEATIDRQPD